MTAIGPLPPDYGEVLAELAAHVRAARRRTQLRVNVELIQLYREIGRTLLAKQRTDAWGSGVLDRVATDLRAEFPSMTGLSRTNLKYMRAFARAWPHAEPGREGQRPVDLLPWGHITVLLGKVADAQARDWYATRAVEQGWSRSMLVNQIMNRALERTGAPPTNFDVHRAAEDSDLARELGRDPYVFDFLDISGIVSERALEQALIDRLADTLRELGSGFAFVGRQMRFTVDGADSIVDLLFFHTEQLRYVVVELKVSAFEPAFTGQLGFYVAVVDDRLRRPGHRPTVGILICAGRGEQAVRYALGSAGSPMAVSTYTYGSLPQDEQDEQDALPAEDSIIAAVRSRGPRATGADAGSETRGPAEVS